MSRHLSAADALAVRTLLARLQRPAQSGPAGACAVAAPQASVPAAHEAGEHLALQTQLLVLTVLAEAARLGPGSPEAAALTARAHALAARTAQLREAMRAAAPGASPVSAHRKH